MKITVAGSYWYFSFRKRAFKVRRLTGCVVVCQEGGGNFRSIFWLCSYSFPPMQLHPAICRATVLQMDIRRSTDKLLVDEIEESMTFYHNLIGVIEEPRIQGCPAPATAGRTSALSSRSSARGKMIINDVFIKGTKGTHFHSWLKCSIAKMLTNSGRV